MTVKEFFKNHRNAVNFSVELYEINKNVQKNTDTQYIDRNGLSEEWYDAEIENWYVSNNTFCLDIIK